MKNFMTVPSYLPRKYNTVMKFRFSGSEVQSIAYHYVLLISKDRDWHTRKQLRNKWDKLKTNFSILKQLINMETGIRWDASHKNIVMPDTWWKKTLCNLCMVLFSSMTSIS